MLEVGNRRPGRVRNTKEAAVLDGHGYARAERSRLFVATTEITLEALAALHLAGALDDPDTGLGAPVADLRNPTSRLEARRQAMLRALPADRSDTSDER